MKVVVVAVDMIGKKKRKILSNVVCGVLDTRVIIIRVS